METQLKRFDKVWYKELPAIILDIRFNEVEIAVCIIFNNRAYWINQLCCMQDLTFREEDYSKIIYELRKDILN